MYWRQVLANANKNRGKTVNKDPYQVASPDQSLSGYEPKKLFHQLPTGMFEECSFADGFASRTDGRSLLSADLDGDGDEELVLLNRNEPRLQLFENRSKVQRAIELRLVRAKGIRDGAGAQVLVSVGEQKRVFPVVLARGFATATPARVHVGMGSAKTANVEVRWPGGVTQRFEGLAVGNVWTLEEGGGAKNTPFVTRADPKRVTGPTTLESFGLKPFARRTIVAFVSRGCEPCKAEMPELNQLAKDGFAVVGISTDGTDGASADETKSLLHAEFDVLPLSEGIARQMESLGVFALPVSIVYGPDGRWERVIHSLRALSR